MLSKVVTVAAAVARVRAQGPTLGLAQTKWRTRQHTHNVRTPKKNQTPYRLPLLLPPKKLVKVLTHIDVLK